MTTCDHLGAKTGELVPHPSGNGRLFVYECRHPAHKTTTILDCHHCDESTLKSGCASCMKPDTSVASVKQLLSGRPAPWPNGWQHWENVAQAFRELFDEYAGHAKTMAVPSWPVKRGIVICGGGWKFFPSIYVTCRVIRHVGCWLPIQIWHMDGERDERMVRILETVGGYISWVNGSALWRERSDVRLRPMKGFDHGWMLKPFAAAFSPFAEVLSLDADSYPAYNPEIFMDSHQYRDAGVCFWPDHGKMTEGQWTRFGISARDCPAIESGQFIIDKARHWKPLWLTCWLASHHDYVWDGWHVYGDKDCFNLAWRKLGIKMCMPTKRPGYDTHSYLQQDFANKTLFVHRCQDKFRLQMPIDGQDISQNFSTTQIGKEANIHVQSLPHEDFCFAVSLECQAMVSYAASHTGKIPVRWLPGSYAKRPA